jgi:hypothetical protein
MLQRGIALASQGFEGAENTKIDIALFVLALTPVRSDRKWIGYDQFLWNAFP